MARGAIAYPINMAFRFFFKALIASLVFVLLTQRAEAARAGMLAGTLGAQLQQMVMMILLPLLFAVLFWKSDSIATGLLRGEPGLSIGNVLQAAAGGAALATGAGALAMGGAGMAASAAGGALRLGSAAQTAFQLGAATSTGGPVAQLAGGMQGLLRAGGGAIGGMVTSQTGPMMAALRNNVQRGARAGFVASGGTLPATMTAQHAPVMMRPGPSFGTQLRQTLQTSAYYFGHDQSHGGVTPH
jgi:type IV secretory pathway TrbL component